MTLVPGIPMLETAADPRPALFAMADRLALIRTAPLGPFATLPRVDSADHYINRIRNVWAPNLANATDEPRTTELTQLLKQWQARGDADVLAENTAPCLSRGDSNALNWLSDGQHLNVVDFEYSGYSDTAYDAADIIEHISMRTINDDVWHDLLPSLGVSDRATRRRFLAAQRTCALRWIAVLWKQRHKRRSEFETQVERVHLLLEKDFQ